MRCSIEKHVTFSMTETWKRPGENHGELKIFN